MQLTHYDRSFFFGFRGPAYYKLFLPTSESSQQRGLIAKLQGEWLFSQNLSADVKLGLRFKPSYNFTKSPTYATSENRADRRTLRIFSITKRRSNRSLENEVYFDVKKKLSRTFTFTQTLGLTDTWNAGDSEYGISHSREEDLVIAPTLEMNWAKGFNMIFIFQNSMPVVRSNGFIKDQRAFKATETDLLLLTSVSF